MPNYLTVLANCFPGAEAYTGGSPEVYDDLIWVTTPIPQATLDASDCAQNPGDYEQPDPVEAVIDVPNLNDGDSIAYDSASGQFVAKPPSIVGSVFNVQFAYEASNVKNKWLSYSGGNSFTSNSVPCVLPFDCDLIGIMFSNRGGGVDTDVKLYKADAGSANADANVLTWQVRNARTAYKTNFASPISFNAGDKVAIYFSDQGGDPDYPIVTLVLKVSTTTTGEQSENFSGYF
jgi:hypothetical protein